MTVKELLNELSGMVEAARISQYENTNNPSEQYEISSRMDADLEAIVRVTVLLSRHMPGKLDCEVKE